MDRIALLNKNERENIFVDTSSRMNILNTIVEKDFWVCWVLGRIFADKELQKILCFKGGTSLSKAFKVIDRFSEDIDLILDWNTILDGDTIKQPSATKQDAFNKDIEVRAEKYISTVLKKKISGLLKGVCTVRADESDGHILYVGYPASFPESYTYIRPEIKLEIGPLAAWVPNAKYQISPYVAEMNSELKISTATVPTIKAERTFWEKATILHREYHRPKGHTPPRYSRHYYDLFKMGNSRIKDAALANLALLSDVVDFKDRFYHCGWAKYNEAKSGLLCLYPNEAGLDVLADDYKNMRNMIFGDYPDWNDILKYLRRLEEEIRSFSNT
jgi:hypothetical protein